MEEKRFWLLAAVLLAVMAAAQLTSIVQENQTWDEAIHIRAGYHYVKLGDFRLNPEHPPLGKMLNALPLLFLHPSIPADEDAWKRGDHVLLGNLFLYTNRIPADTLLFWARSVTIVLTMLLGIALAWWTRKRFGAPAALFALFLFAFDPNIIAHGRYVTSDLIVALFIFLSCVLWAEFLEERRTRNLVLAGIALGCALVSKFSAVILIPIFLLLYLIRWWQKGESLSMRHLVRSFPIVVALAAAVILITYAPDPFTQGHFRLSDHRYLAGLEKLAEKNRLGHDSYLLGQLSKMGWWYYFPVVFAVKTPVAVLGAFALSLCLIAMGTWGRSPTCPDRRQVGDLPHCVRQLPFRWFATTIPAMVFFAAAVASHIDIGVRHILPVYPFLFAFIGGVLFRLGPVYLKRAFPVVVALSLCLLLVESIRIYPHYLAFFNFASGGPDAGPRYLLDSNLDWGQDMKKLKRYMDAHHIPYACTAYFGNGNFAYYGIVQRYLPATWELKERENVDCVAAVSATALYDLYVPEGSYRWLRELKPVERIGYSIYLYDLRKKPAGSPQTTR